MGRLDGTNPLEVLERGNQLDFAPLFEAEENFSVTATGDTLAELKVADGDIVVLRRARMAKDGDIVLALVDGVAPVLRIYSKDAKHVRLSASGKTKPIVSNSVRILGKAVAVIRTL
jgi:repressor LexA